MKNTKDQSATIPSLTPELAAVIGRFRSYLAGKLGEYWLERVSRTENQTIRSAEGACSQFGFHPIASRRFYNFLRSFGFTSPLNEGWKTRFFDPEVSRVAAAGDWREVERLTNGLDPEDAKTLRLYAQYFCEFLLPFFRPNVLEEALRTNRSQWGLACGLEIDQPFELYEKKPEQLSAFTELMHRVNMSENARVAPLVLNATDRSVLDVAGGSGSLALALARHSGELRKIETMEHPDGIALLRNTFLKFATKHEEDRISFIGGSLFETNSEGGFSALANKEPYDLGILGWILHDWNDDLVVKILSATRRHIRKGGRLVVLEALLDEDGMGPETLSDMIMLLIANSAERTFSAYKELIEFAGYQNVRLLDSPGRRKIIAAEK